jgi:hypothetical protein
MRMSQRCVERVIGALATDEGLRFRFRRNPRAALGEMMARGMELTDCEQGSLLRLDPEALSHFASVIDGRLQRASVDGGDV